MTQYGHIRATNGMLMDFFEDRLLLLSQGNSSAHDSSVAASLLQITDVYRYNKPMRFLSNTIRGLSCPWGTVKSCQTVVKDLTDPLYLA